MKMDEENDQTVYKIETVDDNLHSDNEAANKIILNNTPIVICSGNGVPSQYMPCIEDGQIVLRKIEDSNISRLSETPMKTEHSSDEELSEEITIVDEPLDRDEIKTEPVILNSSISLPKKKLSYQTTFTPALPTNNGSCKGLIRYGRKHLIIDQQIIIPPREFKRQLTNAEDLVSKLELAPYSKQQMQRMLSGFTRMFAYSAHKMPNAKLLQLYVSNCISRKQENLLDIADMDNVPGNNCVVPFDFNTVKRFSRKRKCSDSDKELLSNETGSDTSASKENDELVCYKQCVENTSEHTECLEVDSTSLDHKYSKQFEPYMDNDIVDRQALVTNNEKILGLNEDPLADEQFMIVDDSGAEITQNNLELLLAAASESTALNQIVTISDDSELPFTKRVVFVRDENVEQILGSEY